MGLFDSFHSDKFSTHQGQCGGCAHSIVSTRKLNCYCDKRKATYKLNESRCRYYESDLSKNYDFWKKIYTYYILTAISDILGIDKNSEVYQEFMTLIQLVREDVSLVNDAVNYDIYGREIACNLYLDPNGQEICKNLLINYLSKAFVAIKENNQEEAIRIYKEMVKSLHSRYQKQEDYSNIINVDNLENEKVLSK